MEKDNKLFFKSLIIMFGYAIPGVILSILLTKLLGHINAIEFVIDFMMLYIVPLSLAFGLIRFQAKLKEGK